MRMFPIMPPRLPDKGCDMRRVGRISMKLLGPIDPARARTRKLGTLGSDGGARAARDADRRRGFGARVPRGVARCAGGAGLARPGDAIATPMDIGADLS